MRHTKISFSGAFQLPTGNWQTIYDEIQLDEGDDPRQAFYEAKKTVENFFWESNKAAEKQSEQERTDEIGNVMGGIATCTDLKVLESYKLLARTNNEWNEAYRNKFIELSNQKS